MKKHAILAHIGFLSIVFALLHIFALNFSLYWTTGWFDVVMHTFGGFLGSLIVVYVLHKIGISPRSIHKKLFLVAFVILCVFSVGVVWELWEIFTGLTDPFTDVADTIADLVMDTIGATTGFIYYDKKLKPKAE